MVAPASSNGSVPTGRALARLELGAAGLSHSYGVITEEWLHELQGPRWLQTLREMLDNEPIIGAARAAVDLLIRPVEFTVVPADDSAAAQQDAQFITECLHDMRHPWQDVLSNILTFPWYGFAPLELVYKERRGDHRDPTRRSKHNDGRIGWHAWAIRAPESISRWDLAPDSDTLRGLYQIPAPQYREIYIPEEKFLLFRTTAYKENPEGRSILRSAFVPWYFKKHLQKVEAIGVERDLAGLPVLYAPAMYLNSALPGYDPAINAYLKKLVTTIRRDEQEGILLPSDLDPETKAPAFKLELLSTGGTRQFNTDPIIGRYSQHIAMTLLADFILLGHEKVGSFALSSDKTALFGAALGVYLDIICDVANEQAIPRLLRLNGRGGGATPTLQHGDVETPNLTEIADYITKLSGAGVPLFPDAQLEDYLRRIAKLPTPPLEELEAKQAEIEEERRERAKAEISQLQPEAEEEDEAPARAAAERRLFHLPGQHDQKAHGRGGGGGEVSLEQAGEDWFDFEYASAMKTISRGESLEGFRTSGGETLTAAEHARLEAGARALQAAASTTNSGHRTLYRGVVLPEGVRDGDIYPVGKRVTLAGLSAASPDRGIASIYTNPENVGGGKPLLLHFENPNGIIGYQRDPGEVILPHGAQYRVARRWQEGGLTNLTLYSTAKATAARQQAAEPHLWPGWDAAARRTAADDQEADAAFAAGDPDLEHTVPIRAYEPNQPRVPAGSPQGGQWTDGGGAGALGDAQSARDWANSSFQPWQDSLTEVEQEIIGGYIYGAAFPINDFLRSASYETDDLDDAEMGGDGESGVRSMREQAEILNGAMKKPGAVLDRDVVVYRGIADVQISDSWSDIRVGKRFSDKGFVSTSLNPEVAKKFAENSESVERAVVAKILLKKGQRAAWIEPFNTTYSPCDELLLPPGTRFRVVGKEEQGNIGVLALETVN